MYSLSQSSLHKDQFHLRPATIRDIELLWEWANAPSVRANSFHTETIPFDEHVEWLQKKLLSPDTFIQILCLNQVPVAQIRYDRLEGNMDSAEIDFSVVSDYRGKGLGLKILTLTTDMACNKLGVNYLRGVVLNSNKASASAFTKAGFKYQGQEQLYGKLCSIYMYTKSELQEA